MKASAYLSIFDDWQLLEPALNAIDPYVDEIVVVDGAYAWLSSFINRTGRDASRSIDAVYNALDPFAAKTRFIHGIWENELEKRMAGYAACTNRHVFRVDADEILFIDESHLHHFLASDYAVAEMEMPIYIAPGLIRATSETSPIERQALLFDRDKITARDHLDYLWLVLSRDEDATRHGADAEKIYPDPIAFNAHLTHWRPPESAVNRARFYVSNYIRATGDAVWLNHYRQSPDDKWDDMLARVDVTVANDVLLGHAIVVEPPDMKGFMIRPSPLSAAQERVFAPLYDNLLNGLAAINEDLTRRPRHIVTGNEHAIDLSSQRAIAPFIHEGRFSLRLETPVAAATAKLMCLGRDTLYTERDWPFEIDAVGTTITFSPLPPDESLRRTLKLQVWNRDGSALNQCGCVNSLRRKFIHKNREPGEYRKHLSEQIISWIENQNEFESHRRLRRYQKKLMTTGQFDFPNPFGHGVLKCTGTIYFGIKAFAWLFDSSMGPIWLTSGDPSTAYEISGLFFLKDSLFFDFATNLCSISPDEQIEAIADVNDNLAFLSGATKQPANQGQIELEAMLVIGHENFAHFMWNELPAIIEAESETECRASIYATWEPITPLHKLTKLTTEGRYCKVSADSLMENRGFSSRILFALGSTKMSLETKRRIRQQVRSTSICKEESFVVWISIRNTHRYPLNQIETYSNLIHKLYHLPFDLKIILDGYSIADDIEVDFRYHAELQRRLSFEASRLAGQLISLLDVNIREDNFIIDATRLTIPESIALAAEADFYICHHGTQQHKIGWIYDVPGIIHAPPSVLRNDPAGWTADQSEGSVLPYYIPLEFVADEGGDQNDTPDHSKNYIFVDIDGFCEYTIGKIIESASMLHHSK